MKKIVKGFMGIAISLLIALSLIGADLNMPNRVLLDEIEVQASTVITYAIKYDGNGATSGTMAKKTGCKYGTSYTLAANAFKKKGYTFKGWNTKADGSGTSYSNKATVKNLTSKDGKTVTLYAQWKKTKYTITYKLNGGTNASTNPAYYYVTSSTITLAKPKKSGYTFKGWYSDSDCTKKITEIAKGSTGNKTLYAKWTKTKYSITYELSGGTNNSANPSSYYITSATIKLASPTKAGYTFKGWYTDSACTKQITEITKGSTGNKKIYAKWAKKKSSGGEGTQYVWLSATGSKYHSINNCGNMNPDKARKVTVQEAIDANKQMCDKCW